MKALTNKPTENIRRFFVGLLTCPLRGLIFPCFNDRQKRSNFYILDLSLERFFYHCRSNIKYMAQ